MGALTGYQSLIMTILVIGILVGAALIAQTSFRDSLTAGSEEYNATSNWIAAQSNISEKAPTAGTLFGIGIIVIAAFAMVGFIGGRKTL